MRIVIAIGCAALVVAGIVAGRFVPDTWAAGTMQRAPTQPPAAPPPSTRSEIRQIPLTSEQHIANLEKRIAELERRLADVARSQQDHLARFNQHTHEIEVPNVGFMSMQAVRRSMEAGMDNPNQAIGIVGQKIRSMQLTGPPK